MFFVKFADGVHHFIQVTDAFVCSEFIFFAQEFLVAHFVDDTFGKNRERSFPCGKQGLPALHQVRKALELNGRTASAVDFGEQVVPEGAFAVAFTFENVFDSRLADCTRRRVDDAQVGGIIFFVSEQTQVCKYVLDFFAIPESHAAKNDRRYTAVI